MCFHSLFCTFARGIPGTLYVCTHLTAVRTIQLRVSRIPFVFDPGFGFEAYADWAASVPLLYVLRGGRVLDPQGGTWPEFVEGRLKVRTYVVCTYTHTAGSTGST